MIDSNPPAHPPAKSPLDGLQMLGCSHHDTDVSVREKLALTAAEVRDVLNALAASKAPGELVGIATCNRVEWYAAGWPSDGVLIDFVARVHGQTPGFIAAHFKSRRRGEVAAHLFRVAASMESLVVGEAQIVAQVRDGFARARAAGTAGPLTTAVFDAASRAAKRVQNETTIHRRRLSVPSVAVGEVVPEVFEKLGGKQVLVCGTGEMATETLRYLVDAGADRIRVLGRRAERAAEVAARFSSDRVSAEPGVIECLPAHVAAADLIVGTTASDRPLIDVATFRRMIAGRGDRLTLILDLAVPRDFDAAIGELPGVYLYQIDDLRAACDRNRRERQKQWPAAERIIEEEVTALAADLRRRSGGPVIKQLRDRAEVIKRAELTRLLGKLNGVADPAIAAEIEKSFDRLTNKILHPPMVSLRRDAADDHRGGLLEALRQLFHLGEDP